MTLGEEEARGRFVNLVAPPDVGLALPDDLLARCAPRSLSDGALSEGSGGARPSLQVSTPPLTIGMPINPLPSIALPTCHAPRHTHLLSYLRSRQQPPCLCLSSYPSELTPCAMVT